MKLGPGIVDDDQDDIIRTVLLPGRRLSPDELEGFGNGRVRTRMMTLAEIRAEFPDMKVPKP